MSSEIPSTTDSSLTRVDNEPLRAIEPNALQALIAEVSHRIWMEGPTGDKIKPEPTDHDHQRARDITEALEERGIHPATKPLPTRAELVQFIAQISHFTYMRQRYVAKGDVLSSSEATDSDTERGEATVKALEQNGFYFYQRE